MQLLGVGLDAVMADIAVDHRQVFVLAAAVEAEPEAEAIRQRHLLLDRLAGIDARRALVLDHVARQQMPPIRGRVEDDVLRPAFDAAFEHRLERLVARVVGVERQVVAEHDEAVVRGARHRHQFGQALDVLAVDLDELQGSALTLACELGVDRRVRGLHQRRLAHAAGAPQKRVVGRQAAREALGVLDQRIADAVDALKQRHLDAVDARHRHQSPVRMPNESVGCVEIGRGLSRRREALQRHGDALEHVRRQHGVS